MDKQKIAESDAAEIHGISTNHEKMPNGELRFRLISADGNDYIRTVAGKEGAWQEAHSHASLQETYVVVKGWMALAERAGGVLEVSVYWPGDVVTTRPTAAHNVYLPAHAVIHTVKQGANESRDWKEEAELTAETDSLTEKDVLLQGVRNKSDDVVGGQRFDAYVALYNNLDNLIWRIPGLLAAAAAILVGFAGSVLSKDTAPDIPPTLLAGLFFFIGLLLALSAFSMARIREHHTLAGEWLARMEADGYFHQRRLNVARRWPPPATRVFMWAFGLLASLFWGLTLLALFNFQLLGRILRWGG